ncbi:MAG: hypothetical protein GF416_08280 [Candidatus Altiarchaeales archaeon]|nr:hypothetical protein [Candidatus Altiarchaeales archaeon]MBD3417112.1 hypothetical protein [Candidatus Altiarchaeales archaeon]
MYSSIHNMVEEKRRDPRREEVPASKLPSPRMIFRRLTTDLAQGKLRKREERLSEAELDALRHIMHNGTRDEKYTVKEIINETTQLKNPDWFE